MTEDFTDYPELNPDTIYYAPDTATSQYAKLEKDFSSWFKTLNRVAPVDIYQSSFIELLHKVQSKGKSIPTTMVKAVYNLLGVKFYKEGFEAVEVMSFLERLPSGKDRSNQRKYLEVLESMYELNLVDV